MKQQGTTNTKLLKPSLKKTTRTNLEETVRQQTCALNKKDGQIKRGKAQQKVSDEQLHIRMKAMESVVDGIFIIDAKTPFFPVIYANPAFQQMTGFSQKEIIGKNYFLLYGADADPLVVEEIRNTILQNKSFHGEILNFRKTGEKYWNLLRIALVRDAKGAVSHYVGIQTDITLIRQRDLQIKAQHEELLHVTRVGKLAEFVSSLAHEISQHLKSILSYAQAAKRMLAKREPAVQEILQYIADDDQRASAVIFRLRSLLKKSAPEMKPQNMNILINQTILLVSTDVIVRNIVVKTKLESSLAPVCVDETQIKQVLLNLISNSFDAIESTAGVREILITTTREDDNTIMVMIKDSGCGIPEQNMSKLFTHFFTSKTDGLGMGLSICRSIVEAHGGCLNAKNNPDHGSTFYFTLPVIK